MLLHLRSEHIAALPKQTVRSARRNMRHGSSSVARFVASAGSWAARTERSTRVYHEYMPIRGGTYGESDYVGKKIWRSFDMGDLAKVVAVEMRLTVRSAHAVLSVHASDFGHALHLDKFLIWVVITGA